MDPRPPKNKRSFSKLLGEGWDKSFRRPPSPLPSPTPSTRSLSPSPFPDARSVSPSASVGEVETQPLIQAPQPKPGVSCLAPVCKPPDIVISSEAIDPPYANESLAHPETLADSDHDADDRATSKVWAGLVTGLQALHINKRLPSPLQSAIGTFIPCLDVLEEVARNRHEYEELASELACTIDLLTQHGKQSSSARMSGSIVNIARSIEEQAKLIEKKRGRGRGRRLMEANVDMEELERHYRRVRSLFRQLQADANLSIWNIVNDQMANIRLKELAPVQMAYYNSKLSTGISRRTCTPNTRTAILSGLNDWSHDPNAADMYWMNGMAGTGKTTIASSFSESLEERKQLAASFFCTRTVPECREATRIIPTIAYQLARYSVPFQSALCEALGEDPDVSAKNMVMQFERLLKRPLLKVKEAIPNDLVVVIDALDECNDMREVELLLSILLKSIEELPLKFFVTSRPEPEIYRRMLVRSQGAGDVLHLHDVQNSLVQADIEVYIAEELEFMSPTSSQIKELARRSGKLFIYAATLVRYIKPGRRPVDPHTRLESVLAMTSQSNNMHAEIDGLYTAVLKSALDTEGMEDREVQDLRLVLWTAVCVQEPVSIDTIAEVTGLTNTKRVLSALETLRSVIHFSETSGLVSTLHASFPEFMFDIARSKTFSCDFAGHSKLLTRRCFEVMRTRLHFNICELESSFIPDSKVGDLEERVSQSVSPPLWYACRYWGDHLHHSLYSDPLCDMLNDFLSVRLLFWMEVLNLKREIRMGTEILLRAKLWLKSGAAPADLARLTEDARNFVTSFSANPVSESTPHIYLSSLPFCPRSSSVFKQYWAKMQGITNVTGSAMQMREAAPLASWKTQSKVCSVAYSPDGSCVAVGCQDGTVSVRSAYDGTLITGPHQGHGKSVYSVAYSPDGSRIVSGSRDNTIRVWSAHDGTLLAGPFQGHTDWVYSVAYSPDGSRIVSGSADKTIRVWSAHDGTLLAGPFQGHTKPVCSIAYSPDGSRIASGSSDKTVRVWSAHNGTLLASPFRGHTNSVWSVAYSPDGSRIVSGSEDGTIRVWSAHDGALLVGPFQGHTDWVYSVAYSPDGTCIVSGSADKTIRIWGAHSGVLHAGPFQGHTDQVFSVAYASDGSRIISGSADNTVRVWSAHDGALSAGPSQGHTNSAWSVALSSDGLHIVSGSRDDSVRAWSAHGDAFLPSSSQVCTDSDWVYSVAYSPDGSRIVSGSRDDSIRVWSAHNGTLLVGPLQGHTNSIYSVAFSPDSSRIASGSADNTIRVWSAYSGAPLAGPFQGHTGLVWSVSYSPDGSRIVSGSADKTIRVWSAHDGTLLAGPFQGHTDPVYSVAYSPDGSRIASGSADSTIRVWSAYSGTPLADPFRGHTGSVWSVSYSPDGSHIVSGSRDKTIQVWNAHDGILTAGPFQGHTDWVYSVAYSPDGSCIVSGSRDNAIRIWSVHGGTLLAGPFQGHTGSVWSVAYSPDGSRIISGSSDTTVRVWSAHVTPLVAGPSQGHTDSVSLEVYSPAATHADSSTHHPITLPTQNSPTTYQVSQPNPSLVHSSWTVGHNRWVVDSNFHLLFWIPYELAGYLPSGNELLVIYPHDSLRIDQDNVFVGELWPLCYKPE